MKTESSGGLNVTNPVYLLTNKNLYLYHPNINKLSLINVPIVPLSRIHVIPNRTESNVYENMIIASPDLIQQCQMPKQTCTSVKIKLGAVKDISCTNSGDYCLIAADQGIFEV